MFARRRDLLEREAERIGALAVRGDLTVPKDLARLVDTTVDAFGGIDVLVNNGGGPPPGRPPASTDDAIESAVELLLLSAIRLTNLCLPHLEASGRGRIVNIESSSVRSPIDGLALSNAIRPGLVGWMKTLAREVAPEGDHREHDRARAGSTPSACARSAASPMSRRSRWAARRAGRDRIRRLLPGLRPRGLRHRGGRTGRRRHHAQPALIRKLRLPSPATLLGAGVAILLARHAAILGSSVRPVPLPPGHGAAGRAARQGQGREGSDRRRAGSTTTRSSSAGRKLFEQLFHFVHDGETLVPASRSTRPA